MKNVSENTLNLLHSFAKKVVIRCPSIIQCPVKVKSPIH